MNLRRIWLGLLVTLVFNMLVGALISLTNLAIHPAAQAVVLVFIGTALGGFIARRKFILPSLGLWLLSSIAAIYVVYVVAEPVGQASITGILLRSAESIICSFISVISGAVFGQYLARRYLCADSKI